MTTPDDDKRVETVAKALCQSGRFETGQGTCALLCMGMLGDARSKCSYRNAVHSKLAKSILAALDKQERKQT